MATVDDEDDNDAENDAENDDDQDEISANHNSGNHMGPTKCKEGELIKSIWKKERERRKLSPTGGERCVLTSHASLPNGATLTCLAASVDLSVISSFFGRLGGAVVQRRGHTDSFLLIGPIFADGQNDSI